MPGPLRRSTTDLGLWFRRRSPRSSLGLPLSADAHLAKKHSAWPRTVAGAHDSSTRMLSVPARAATGLGAPHLEGPGPPADSKVGTDVGGIFLSFPWG